MVETLAEAMTGEDVRRTLERVTYKPGWRLVFDDNPVEGWVLWVILSGEPDAYHPEREAKLQIETFIPRSLRTPSDLLDWLLWKLTALEAHEAREWFRVDGKPHSDPHAERRPPATHPPDLTPHAGH